MVTLADAKAYCCVDFDDDDVQLGQMILAAQKHLSDIGVDITQDPMPEAVDQAVLMLVGHFYDNRNAMTDERLQMVDIGVDRLIASHRGFCL